MADNEGGGGNGFTGLIAGLLIAAVLVGGGFYLYNHTGQRTAEINVTVPTPDTSNGG